MCEQLDRVGWHFCLRDDGISGKLIAARWDPWEDFNKNREQLENSDIFTLRRVLPEDMWIELR